MRTMLYDDSVDVKWDYFLTKFKKRTTSLNKYYYTDKIYSIIITLQMILQLTILHITNVFTR